MAMGEPRKEKYRVHCSMLGEFHCICILYLPPTESLQCHSDCPDGGAIAPTGVHTPEGGVRLPRWRWGSPEKRSTESTVQCWANSIAFVYYTFPRRSLFNATPTAPTGVPLPRRGCTPLREGCGCPDGDGGAPKGGVQSPLFNVCGRIPLHLYTIPFPRRGRFNAPLTAPTGGVHV